MELGCDAYTRWVLRMGFTCAADFGATVRLVVNGVENVATEVRKPRGQLSAFVIYDEPLDFQAGAVLSFASTDAPLESIASLEISFSG